MGNLQNVLITQNAARSDVSILHFNVRKGFRMDGVNLAAHLHTIRC